MLFYVHLKLSSYAKHKSPGLMSDRGSNSKASSFALESIFKAIDSFSTKNPANVSPETDCTQI